MSKKVLSFGNNKTIHSDTENIFSQRLSDAKGVSNFKGKLQLKGLDVATQQYVIEKLHNLDGLNVATKEYVEAKILGLDLDGFNFEEIKKKTLELVKLNYNNLDGTRTYNFIGDGKTTQFNFYSRGTDIAVFVEGIKINKSDFIVNINEKTQVANSITFHKAPQDGDEISCLAFGGLDVYSKKQVDDIIDGIKPEMSADEIYSKIKSKFTTKEELKDVISKVSTVKGRPIASENYVDQQISAINGNVDKNIEVAQEYSFVSDGKNKTYVFPFLGTGFSVFIDGIKIQEDDFISNFNKDTIIGNSITLKHIAAEGSLIDCVSYGRGGNLFTKDEAKKNFVSKDEANKMFSQAVDADGKKIATVEYVDKKVGGLSDLNVATKSYVDKEIGTIPFKFKGRKIASENFVNDTLSKLTVSKDTETIAKNYTFTGDGKTNKFNVIFVGNGVNVFIDGILIDPAEYILHTDSKHIGESVELENTPKEGDTINITVLGAGNVYSRTENDKIFVKKEDVRQALEVAPGDKIATEKYVQGTINKVENNVNITHSYSFIGDGSKKTFSFSFIPEAVHIFVEGILVKEDSYTKNINKSTGLGTSITLENTPSKEDEIICIAYGGADVYSKTQANSRFVQKDVYKKVQDNYTALIGDYILANTTVKIAQVDETVVDKVNNDEDYIITLNDTDYKYTSDDDATKKEIIDGLVKVVNDADIDIKAENKDDKKVILTSKTAGNAFTISVSDDLSDTNKVPNKPGSFKVSLNSKLPEFTKIKILDVKSNFDNDNLTLTVSGSDTIVGSTDDYKLSIADEFVTLLKVDNDWRIIS